VCCLLYLLLGLRLSRSLKHVLYLITIIKISLSTAKLSFFPKRNDILLMTSVYGTAAWHWQNNTCQFRRLFSTILAIREFNGSTDGTDSVRRRARETQSNGSPSTVCRTWRKPGETSATRDESIETSRELQDWWPHQARDPGGWVVRHRVLDVDPGAFFILKDASTLWSDVDTGNPTSTY
jgi:hypothetical protein